MTAINTATVSDRRRLRLHTIDDALADVERIVTADRAGKLRRTGNWTAGQTLGHIATWINYAWEGYPFSAPPWFIRAILRLKKRGYIQNGMPAGVHIPRAEGGTYATKDMSTEEGARLLRSALSRLKSGEAVKFESPGWGKMTKEERVALNLRHAELHLSFLHPK